jgi:ubiquinone/menaquinone biosynthesis C-methylase UbiE
VTTVKDLFSKQSDVYSKFRPDYPSELFEYILQFVKERNTAWDCGTGNGQAAKILSLYFNKVEASDISKEQLDKAVKKNSIHYIVSPAESTPYPDNNFDLITIATAYHWFKWDAFQKEAQRVGRNGAVIAAWAYNMVQFEDDAVNKILHHFYNNIVYAYWDSGRRHVETSYKNVPFNFEPLPTKDFYIHLEWSLEQLTGYLESWSAVQTFIIQNNTNPIELMNDQLKNVWKEGTTKKLQFPVFLKIGRISK